MCNLLPAPCWILFRAQVLLMKETNTSRNLRGITLFASGRVFCAFIECNHDYNVSLKRGFLSLTLPQGCNLWYLCYESIFEILKKIRKGNRGVRSYPSGQRFFSANAYSLTHFRTRAHSGLNTESIKSSNARTTKTNEKLERRFGVVKRSSSNYF